MKTSLIAILVPLFGLIASAEMHAKHPGGEVCKSHTVAYMARCNSCERSDPHPFHALIIDVVDSKEASPQSVACPTRDKVKWYIDKLTELTYNGLRACDCRLCSQCSRCSEHLKPEIREILHKLESMEATVLPMLTRDCEDLNACINAPLPDSRELADCKSDLATCEIDEDSLEDSLGQCNTDKGRLTTSLTQCQTHKDCCNTQLTQCNNGRKFNGCFRGHIGLTDQFTCLTRKGDGVEAARCMSSDCNTQNFLLPQGGHGPIVSTHDGKCLNAYSLKFEPCVKDADCQHWVYVAYPNTSRQVAIRQLTGPNCLKMNIPKGQEHGSASLGTCAPDMISI